MLGEPTSNESFTFYKGKTLTQRREVMGSEATASANAKRRWKPKQEHNDNDNDNTTKDNREGKTCNTASLATEALAWSRWPGNLA
mmetsp:Transcript_44065/g.66586  ORF Transcript_44065/g.66586 Transcript_44065/m.66586 type:complete len:85 (+) Transcript_44065:340-594(+)